MRQYTWDEYYEKFYYWSESTQIRNLSALSSLGSADEVGEIIIELQVDKNAADRLLKRANEAKLAFSGSDIIEFVNINDKKLAVEALRNSAERLTTDDLEYICGEIDDDIIIEICEKMHLELPEELRETDEDEDILRDNDDICADLPQKSFDVFRIVAAIIAVPFKILGALFTAIAALFGAIGSFEKHEHNGKCNGDCANCPPHYGYRYGRWYYGHDHVHGCEFGGNRGSGKMD